MGATSFILATGLAVATQAGHERHPNPGPVRSTIAQGTASVRILTPALIGPGYGPPQAGMELRLGSVTLPDGQRAPIRLYEFE